MRSIKKSNLYYYFVSLKATIRNMKKSIFRIAAFIKSVDF